MNYFFFTAICVSLFKILLLPTYKSTDFEVHRNWLSITYNLPICKWYSENTSQWTLDYPPFFAFFEYFLSYFGKFFDKEMLKISSIPYDSFNTTLFQKLTVLITDFIYYYASYLWFLKLKKQTYSKKLFLYEFYGLNLSISIIFLWIPSLILVDHIHFQYNGFLNGLLLLSILKLVENKFYQSTIFFCILLNLKHIYLYIAPVFFIYLLKAHCLTNSNRIYYKRFFNLTLIVIVIFSISFGPFIYLGQIKQVLVRLFPFKRGLTHSYWAPNFWAIYNTLDLILNLISKEKKTNTSMTKGLVQQFEHQVLPNITPITCLIIVVLSLIPCLIKLWRNCFRKVYQDKQIFLRCIIICAYSSFLFGWHVHEKAILAVLIPMVPLAFLDKQEAKLFLILNTIATYSLFPLIYQEGETLIKILLLITYNIYSFTALAQIHSYRNRLFTILNLAEEIYLCFFICIQIYFTFGKLILPEFYEKYQFLPLLFTSFYSSIGIFYTYFQTYFNLITS